MVSRTPGPLLDATASACCRSVWKMPVQSAGLWTQIVSAEAIPGRESQTMATIRTDRRIELRMGGNVVRRGVPNQEGEPANGLAGARPAICGYPYIRVPVRHARI